MAKREELVKKVTVPVDAGFVQALLSFVEGGGSAIGIWNIFQSDMLDRGYSAEEIKEQCEAIYAAAGMTR